MLHLGGVDGKTGRTAYYRLLEIPPIALCRGRAAAVFCYRNVHRCGVEEGDRDLAKQLLSAVVEVLFDDIRGGATVADLFAEPSHRQISMIKR